MTFALRKWYLDVTTSDGSYLIFYLGRLSFKSLNIGFTHRIGGGRFADLSSGPRLTSQTDPEAGGDGKVAISDAGRELNVEWTPETAPSSHTLFSSGSGEVEWNCVQPSAQVLLNHRGVTHSGRGYVECLTLTFPPWELGLEHLDWGRYISDTDQLTWIRWRGANPLELAIINGVDTRQVSVDGDRVTAGNTTLQLADKQVIRDGMLGSTVLNKLPAVLQVAPVQMLQLHERKWVSRGRLISAGGGASDGWSIHEQVAWPCPAAVA